MMSGAFTIDSSTPTLKINLNEHRIFINNLARRIHHFSINIYIIMAVDVINRFKCFDLGLQVLIKCIFKYSLAPSLLL
jgi:hypothetical protein